MRVIAGEARGRKLKSGKGLKARPTTDRVKEALFSILGNYVIDANFLDLFAGFGGIGIEAISRGAKKAVFIELNPKHLKIIKENLTLTRFNDRAEVICGDVLKVLPKLNNSFDIIYLDPPYEAGLYEKTLKIIYEKNLIQKDGIIVCEHNTELPPKLPDHFKLLKYKSYGNIGLTFIGVKI
ncbi:16S rRNA (guanine(966)-N(2))-methyltransferase RsmD [Anoxybacter fermentans]|uniref:16S rRNA (Guanine(966)-N(2))-methyltransferase RsmD n=1 Tax=Anoxybacter fermentans TaxID=1323375 RepID=A0A3S9SX45_9FIRM|nr:16S rRNA (guanine(966)-N(2))-methyltransferase RsmD [Anoxybacter fermentans]AZR72869.1 16S rRNA (guanine(966)-N(2))-methyltransferase RsmD [Anoxybacter fermentans]